MKKKKGKYTLYKTGSVYEGVKYVVTLDEWEIELLWVANAKKAEKALDNYPNGIVQLKEETQKLGLSVLDARNMMGLGNDSSHEDMCNHNYRLLDVDLPIMFFFCIRCLKVVKRHLDEAKL